MVKRRSAACPPSKEHSDHLSLNSPSPSFGAQDTRESGNSGITGCVQCCPPVPNYAVSTSSPGIFTYSVEQVQPPDHCNGHTQTGIIPFLGCCMVAVGLPNLPWLPFLTSTSSFPSLISLPLSLAFLLPTASAVFLYLHPCDVLIWGTGQPLSPEASQVHAPSLYWAFFHLQSTSKSREVPLQRESLLQIHPPRKESGTTRACC